MKFGTTFMHPFAATASIAGKQIPKKIAILLAVFLIVAAIPACNSKSSKGTDTTLTQAEIPEEDPWSSVGLTDSDTFDPDSEYGTYLFVKDTRGYEWMLAIPAHALLMSQEITMTVIDPVDLPQSEAKIRSWVRLEPHGLHFTDKVRLFVTPPDTISAPDISLIFSLNEAGTDVEFEYTQNNKEMAFAEIWHFSDYGTDNNSESDDAQMEIYKKRAEKEYKAAIDAARTFIKGGTPTPPVPPTIDMFCRCTSVNPEKGEAGKYTTEFLDPYAAVVKSLLAAMRVCELLSSEADTSGGFPMAQKILQMAEKSILEVGKNYQADSPPDRLYAVIVTALSIERQIALLGGSGEINYNLITWAERVRDYYLDELRKNHDYRAYPIIMRLNKTAVLLGGTDKLEEIFSAMTFEVKIHTSFDATWKEYSGGGISRDGNVLQWADVKDIKMNVPNEYWGLIDGLTMTASSGVYTTYRPDGKVYTSTTLDGMTDIMSLFLNEWDACEKKNFNAIVSSFAGKGTGPDPGPSNVSTPASMVSLKNYSFAGGFKFPIHIINFLAAFGDEQFSAPGSAVDGEFISNAWIHIELVHTPQ